MKWCRSSLNGWIRGRIWIGRKGEKKKERMKNERKGREKERKKNSVDNY